jgi:hypothetical protein
MMRQQAFRTVEQNKKYYAESVKPVEYNYNYKYIVPPPIVLPVPQTKRILAIRSRGGGF